MNKRLIIALGTKGWAGRLVGERLDERIRYEDLPEDKIYPAITPNEAVKLLSRLLPAYCKTARLCKEALIGADYWCHSPLSAPSSAGGGRKLWHGFN